MRSTKIGRSACKRLRETLLGMWLSFALMVSGCASSSQMPVCAQSQVRVDPSLMAEPSYTQTLLDFLSDKPSSQTPK